MQFFKPLRHTLLSITLAVILSVLGGWFILGGGTTETQTVSAGSTDNLSGYAWIGTYDDSNGNGIQNATEPSIGWVSFNCTNPSENCGTSNYGVRIDESQRFSAGGIGAFSGSAWNSTNAGIGIGWISFDRSKTGNPPSDDIGAGSGPIAQVDWTTGNVTGWARVLAGCQDVPSTITTDNSVGGPNQSSCLTRIDIDGGGPLSARLPEEPGYATGGWDGWIKLRSTGVEPSYGVQLTGNNISGYAWGGDKVVGWIKFRSTGSEPSYGVVFTPIGTPPPAGCGTANGVAKAPPGPSANLCSDGSLPPVTDNNVTAPYSWSWTCNNGGSPTSCSAPYTQCSDGIDNDGDGQADAADSGCVGSSGYNASDNTERDFKFKEF